MKSRRIIIWLVMWLTRLGGATFVLAGLGFFVTAWQDRAVVPIVMGIITIAIGAVLTSIKVVPGDRMEYGLLRPKRRPS
jgi:hypothetical protein